LAQERVFCVCVCFVQPKNYTMAKRCQQCLAGGAEGTAVQGFDLCETRSCLYNLGRANSGHGRPTSELNPMSITALELNGTAHELGWFPPEASVAEIKRRASQIMCVPAKAISLASSDSSGSSVTDGSYIRVAALGPGANLTVVVQMPAIFEETLKRVDDIRVHEGVYDELVSFACQFKGKCLTPANVSVLQRVVQLICDSLRTAKHKASRGWAIKALSELLGHSMQQMGQAHHTTRHVCDNYCTISCKYQIASACSGAEKLENVMLMIVEGLQAVNASDYWLERDEARAALAKLDSLKSFELNPDAHSRLVAAVDASKEAHALGGA